MGGNGFASHLGKLAGSLTANMGASPQACLARMGSVLFSFEAKLVAGSTPMPIDCKGKAGFDQLRRTTDVQCTLSTGFLFLRSWNSIKHVCRNSDSTFNLE